MCAVVCVCVSRARWFNFKRSHNFAAVFGARLCAVITVNVVYTEAESCRDFRAMLMRFVLNLILSSSVDTSACFQFAVLDPK